MAGGRKPCNAFNVLHPEGTDLLLYVRTEARSKPHLNSRGTLCLDLSRTDVCMTRGHRAGTWSIEEAVIVWRVDLESTVVISKLSATSLSRMSSKTEILTVEYSTACSPSNLVVTLSKSGS